MSEPLSDALVDGAMIANKKGVPGTLGCRAWLDANGQALLLSSYHVLFGRKALRGDPIWRVWPGLMEHRYVTIGRNLHGKAGIVRYRGESYFIDAAAAELAPGIPGLDAERPAGPVAEAALGGIVTKTGAATGRTVGRIVDVCYPDRWFSDYQSLEAPNQLLIAPVEGAEAGRPFCRTGDSGAIVRDSENNAVGLLWGSNARGEGVACHIGPVLHALGIRLDAPRAAEGFA